MWFDMNRKCARTFVLFTFHKESPKTLRQNHFLINFQGQAYRSYKSLELEFDDLIFVEMIARKQNENSIRFLNFGLCRDTIQLFNTFLLINLVLFQSDG